jgi:hypothetical protein
MKGSMLTQEVDPFEAYGSIIFTYQVNKDIGHLGRVLRQMKKLTLEKFIPLAIACFVIDNVKCIFKQGFHCVREKC